MVRGLNASRLSSGARRDRWQHPCSVSRSATACAVLGRPANPLSSDFPATVSVNSANRRPAIFASSSFRRTLAGGGDSLVTANSNRCYDKLSTRDTSMRSKVNRLHVPPWRRVGSTGAGQCMPNRFGPHMRLRHAGRRLLHVRQRGRHGGRRPPEEGATSATLPVTSAAGGMRGRVGEFAQRDEAEVKSHCGPYCPDLPPLFWAPAGSRLSWCGLAHCLQADTTSSPHRRCAACLRPGGSHAQDRLLWRPSK